MWPFKRKPKVHWHWGYRWDNYYEICKCGVSAGDYRTEPYGTRAVFFEEWPTELRKVTY